MDAGAPDRDGSRSKSRERSRSKSPSKGRSKSKSKSRSRSRSRSRDRGRSGSQARRNRSRSRSRGRDRGRDRDRRDVRRRSYSRSRSRSRGRGRRRRSYSRSRSRSRGRGRGRGGGYGGPPRRDRDHVEESAVLGVFGLSQNTEEKQVADMMAQHGDLEKVVMIQDRMTGRSKGFGFVYFKSVADARNAKEATNGSTVDGRKIRVDYSFTKKPHEPTPGRYMGRPDQSYQSHSDRGGRRRSPSPYRRSRSRSRSRSRRY